MKNIPAGGKIEVLGAVLEAAMRPFGLGALQIKCELIAAGIGVVVCGEG